MHQPELFWSNFPGFLNIKNLTLFSWRHILILMNIMKSSTAKIVFLMLTAFFFTVWAQDKKPTAPPATVPLVPQEEMNFAYGTVVRITIGQITMAEYDYENDEELKVTYELDPNLKIKNADSLKNITAGKTVEVDFVVKNNRKIVKALSLEEEFNDQMDSTLENYDEDVPANEEE
jgi:hypothetical protein